MPSIVKFSACAIVGLSLAAVAYASDLPGQPQALPHVSTLSAFQTGVYHFYDQNRSLFKLGKKAGKNYRLATEFSKGTPHYFSYNVNSKLF